MRWCSQEANDCAWVCFTHREIHLPPTQRWPWSNRQKGAARLSVDQNDFENLSQGREWAWGKRKSQLKDKKRRESVSSEEQVRDFPWWSSGKVAMQGHRFRSVIQEASTHLWSNWAYAPPTTEPSVQWEKPPTREKAPVHSNEDPVQPSINR